MAVFDLLALTASLCHAAQGRAISDFSPPISQERGEVPSGPRTARDAIEWLALCSSRVADPKGPCAKRLPGQGRHSPRPPPLDKVAAAGQAPEGRVSGGRSNVMDFDDLLSLGNAVLRDPVVSGSYGRRFRHLLVDEFQDTSAAQYHFVRTIAQAGVRAGPHAAHVASHEPVFSQKHPAAVSPGWLEWGSASTRCAFESAYQMSPTT